ncbi:MAG: glycosyltransferase family 2 protein [Actinobacteria bacterium]|jgi:GT2 family glycosyltransferase|nr:MAG: glycosyltransferase family 2 protein [Actinomycetota bacterium]
MPEEPRPLVSFVIPNYQGEKLLSACLDSVYAQKTDIAYEVIVVDDHSTDASTEIVAHSYRQVRLMVNRRNQGCAASKNVGAAEARGEYIAFLDNDIELDAGWLEAMLGRFELEGDRLGICASHILINGYKSLLNSTGGFVNLLGYAWDRGIFGQDTDSYALNTRVMWACAAAMIVKASAFDEMGGFDSVYEYLFDDVDLGWRMNILGYDVAYEPRAIAYHHQGTVQGWKLIRRLYLYERNRIRNALKNMETRTLAWIWRESSFHFLHRMRREWDNGELSFAMKLSLVPRMFQALAWNVLRLRDTLRLKREVEHARKITDQQLMRKGVLCPFLGEPFIMEDPRLVKSALRQDDRNRHLRSKVVMSNGMDGSLGSGWYARELDARGIYFRWADGRAVLHLKARKGKRKLLLYTVMAHPTDTTRVSISINGRFISEVDVPNQPRCLRIDLPPDIPPGDWEIEFTVHNPFSPWEALGIEDHRRLGVAVSKVELS